jgi:sodium/potassium/calcium exchanger 6
MGLPQMAISACFGGPMLNILLGLGLSGSYMIYKNDGQPYHIEVGRTLLVSGVSLFIVLIATLILVPMNNYWMNRKLGAGLIAAYCVVLATNIMVEVWK